MEVAEYIQTFVKMLVEIINAIKNFFNATKGEKEEAGAEKQ